MVLQRNKPVPVYGTAAAGENVTVTFNSQTTSTITNAQGHWQVMLPTMSANATGKTLTITGANTINITDVVVGDVWICSGQSNMAFSLSGCNRQAQDVNTANFPGIRHFWVPLVTSDIPLKTLTGSWAVCSSSTAGGFSAVAFYFGRKIYQDQGGPSRSA
jgi:sialate O-acetylesterase